MVAGARGRGGEAAVVTTWQHERSWDEGVCCPDRGGGSYKSTCENTAQNTHAHTSAHKTGEVLIR